MGIRKASGLKVVFSLTNSVISFNRQNSQYDETEQFPDDLVHFTGILIGTLVHHWYTGTQAHSTKGFSTVKSISHFNTKIKMAAECKIVIFHQYCG